MTHLVPHLHFTFGVIIFPQEGKHVPQVHCGIGGGSCGLQR